MLWYLVKYKNLSFALPWRVCPLEFLKDLNHCGLLSCRLLWVDHMWTYVAFHQWQGNTSFILVDIALSVQIEAWRSQHHGTDSCELLHSWGIWTEPYAGVWCLPSQVSENLGGMCSRIVCVETAYYGRIICHFFYNRPDAIPGVSEFKATICDSFDFQMEFQ